MALNDIDSWFALTPIFNAVDIKIRTLGSIAHGYKVKPRRHGHTKSMPGKLETGWSTVYYGIPYFVNSKNEEWESVIELRRCDDRVQAIRRRKAS